MLSKEQLWEKCLSKIKILVPPESYSTWFSPVYPYSFKENRLILVVPNDFYKACFEENYQDIIRATLSSLTNTQIQLEFKTETVSLTEEKSASINDFRQEDQTKGRYIHASSAINSKYNFSNLYYHHNIDYIYRV